MHNRPVFAGDRCMEFGDMESQMIKLYGSLNERDRRRYAAMEAMQRGRGGMTYISRLFGCDMKTIRRGMSELKSSEQLDITSLRKPGGGRKRLTEKTPELLDNLRAILQEHTAGDPMRQDVKWTNLSRRQISQKLGERGTPAGKTLVSRLLYDEGYRRRKPQKSRTMGQHADRNAQFENIARLKQEYIDADLPVISIDSKKKGASG